MRLLTKLLSIVAANEVSTILRWVGVPIVDNSVCKKVFGSRYVRTSNICIETKGGKSSCQGLNEN